MKPDRNYLLREYLVGALQAHLAKNRTALTICLVNATQLYYAHTAHQNHIAYRWRRGDV
jgi:hypothetical protein